MFIAPQDETPPPLHSHTDLMRNTSGLFKFRRAPHPSLAAASSVRVALAPVPIFFPHFQSLPALPHNSGLNQAIPCGRMRKNQSAGFGRMKRATPRSFGLDREAPVR